MSRRVTTSPKECSTTKLFSLFRSIVDELKPDFVNVGKHSKEPECVSLAWSTDGQTLFGGFTDNLVRVWTVSA